MHCLSESSPNRIFHSQNAYRNNNNFGGINEKKYSNAQSRPCYAQVKDSKLHYSCDEILQQSVKIRTNESPSDRVSLIFENLCKLCIIIPEGSSRNFYYEEENTDRGILRKVRISRRDPRIKCISAHLFCLSTSFHVSENLNALSFIRDSVYDLIRLNRDANMTYPEINLLESNPAIHKPDPSLFNEENSSPLIMKRDDLTKIIAHTQEQQQFHRTHSEINLLEPTPAIYKQDPSPLNGENSSPLITKKDDLTKIIADTQEQQQFHRTHSEINLLEPTPAIYKQDPSPLNDENSIMRREKLTKIIAKTPSVKMSTRKKRSTKTLLNRKDNVSKTYDIGLWSTFACSVYGVPFDRKHSLLKGNVVRLSLFPNPPPKSIVTVESMHPAILSISFYDDKFPKTQNAKRKPVVIEGSYYDENGYELFVSGSSRYGSGTIRVSIEPPNQEKIIMSIQIKNH